MIEVSPETYEFVSALCVIVQIYCLYEIVTNWRRWFPKEQKTKPPKGPGVV